MSNSIEWGSKPVEVTCQICGKVYTISRAGLYKHVGHCRGCGIKLTYAARAATDPPGYKTCRQCGECKPVSEFHKGNVKAHYRDGYRSECKQCSNRRSDKWAAAHPQERRAFTNRWQGANRELYRKIKARWRAEHHDEERAAALVWYYNNREQALQRGKNWRQANKIKTREQEHRRRAREKGQRVGKIDYAVILARDGYWCYLCQQPVAPEDLSFDHVIPLAKGGAHGMDNIRVAHYICNVRKGTKPAPVGS